MTKGLSSRLCSWCQGGILGGAGILHVEPERTELSSIHNNQKSITFPHEGNAHLEMGEKSVSFMIATKIYPNIRNKPSKICDLHAENYKKLVKEIRKDQNH